MTRFISLLTLLLSVSARAEILTDITHQLIPSATFCQNHLSKSGVPLKTLVRGIKLASLKDLDPNFRLFLEGGKSGAIDAADISKRSVALGFAQPTEGLPIGLLITLKIPDSLLQPGPSEDWRIYSSDLLDNGIRDLSPYIYKVELIVR